MDIFELVFGLAVLFVVAYSVYRGTMGGGK